MCRRNPVLIVAILAASTLGLPAQEEEPIPRRKFDKPQDKPADTKLVPAGTVQGRISKISEDGRTLTLTVTFRVREPNPNPDPRNPQTYFRFVDRQQEIEYILAEDVKVRLPPPAPYQVDEKGKRVFKPFKPDPKSDPDYRLGGVKGEVKDLVTGMMVSLELKRALVPGKPINQAPVYATVVKVLANPPSQ